ncbi:MAG: hypothetical protein EXR27_09945 [Betaproteobacteria bacterium]|nr:hypothetical protein [Betaproteobacteria bacterium]
MNTRKFVRVSWVPKPTMGCLNPRVGRSDNARGFSRLAAAFLSFFAALFVFAASGHAQLPQKSTYRWTHFVQVEGQPEPVPAEWVSTPEGKFAHSIRIPNPVPKDSGYKRGFLGLFGMSDKDYFEHLCKTEAGEFIYKTVENVAGFYFMRPPNKPTNKQLQDRYFLEAPGLESPYQVVSATAEERANTFISPPRRIYSYVEEPLVQVTGRKGFVRVFGYEDYKSTMEREVTDKRQSRYGLTWRGIRRPGDRESSISGGEWIVLDVQTSEVLAVRRDYSLSGFDSYAPDGIYWVNAISCPNFNPIVSDVRKHGLLYEFTAKVLNPAKGKQ